MSRKRLVMTGAKVRQCRAARIRSMSPTSPAYSGWLMSRAKKKKYQDVENICFEDENFFLSGLENICLRQKRKKKKKDRLVRNLSRFIASVWMAEGGAAVICLCIWNLCFFCFPCWVNVGLWSLFPVSYLYTTGSGRVPPKVRTRHIAASPPQWDAAHKIKTRTFL